MKATAAALLLLALTAPLTAATPLAGVVPDVPEAGTPDALADVLSALGRVLPLPTHPSLDRLGDPDLTLEERLRLVLTAARGAPSAAPELDDPVPLETALTMFADAVNVPLSIRDYHDAQRLLSSFTPTQRNALASLLRDLTVASLLHQEALADLTDVEREALSSAARVDVGSLTDDQLSQLAEIASGIDRTKLSEAAVVVARAVDRYLPLLSAEPAQPLAPPDAPLVQLVASVHAAATPYARVPIVPPTPQFVPTNDPLLAPAFDKLMRGATAATAPAPGLTLAEAEAWQTFILSRGVAEALPNLRAWSALYLGAPDAAWVRDPGPAPERDLETGLLALARARGAPYTSAQQADLRAQVLALHPSLRDPLARLVSATLYATLLTNEATRGLPNDLRAEIASDPLTLVRAVTSLSSPGHVLSSQEARALENLGKAGEHVDLALIQEAAYVMATTAYAVLPALAVPAEAMSLPFVGTTFEPLAREGRFGFAVDADGDGTEDARITFNGDGTVTLGDGGEPIGVGVLSFNQTGTGTKLYADSNGNGVQECPPPPPPEPPAEGEEPPPAEEPPVEDPIFDSCAEQGVKIGTLLDEDNDVIFRDPNSLVVVTGQGTSFYHPDLMPGGNVALFAPALTVDLGGTDYYAFAAGAGAVTPGLSIELGGSDLYEPLRSDDGVFSIESQGTGILSAGVLIDASGFDTYRTTISGQGFGVLGVGLLVDLGPESDSYFAWDSAQGAGALGIGALIDEGGDDTYTLRPPRDIIVDLVQFGGQVLTGAGQAAALFASGATLVDLAGDDRYEAGPISHGWVAQTFQNGLINDDDINDAPVLTNLALFVEAAGDDTYVKGNGQEEDLLTWSTGLGGIGTDLGPGPGVPQPDPASNDGDQVPDSIETTTAIAVRVTGGALNVTLASAGSVLSAACSALTPSTPNGYGRAARVAYCAAAQAPAQLRDQASGRQPFRDDRADPEQVVDFHLGALLLRVDMRPDGSIHNETDLRYATEPVMVLVDLAGNDTYESEQPLTLVRPNVPPQDPDGDESTTDQRLLLPRALVVVDLDGNDTYSGEFTTILDLARGENEPFPGRGHDLYGVIAPGEVFPVAAGLIVDEGAGSDRYITDAWRHEIDSGVDPQKHESGVRFGMPVIVVDDGGDDNTTGMSRTLSARPAGLAATAVPEVDRELSFQTFFSIGGTQIVTDLDADGVTDAIDPDADGDGLLNEEELGTQPIGQCNSGSGADADDVDDAVAGAGTPATVTGVRRNTTIGGNPICFLTTDPFDADTDHDAAIDSGEVACQRAVLTPAARRRLPVQADLTPPLTLDPYSDYLGEPLQDTDRDGLCDSRDIDRNQDSLCNGADTNDDDVLDKFDHDADGDGLCIVGDSDIDGDGLRNDWEIQFYELGLSRANPPPPPCTAGAPPFLDAIPHPYDENDGGLDPDCDGKPNALEYLLGEDPVQIIGATQQTAQRLLLAPLLDIELRAPAALPMPPSSLHVFDVALSIDMSGDDRYQNNAGAAFQLGPAITDSRRWASAPYLATLVRGPASVDAGLGSAVPLAGSLVESYYERALTLLWETANLAHGIPGGAATEAIGDGTALGTVPEAPPVGPNPDVRPFVPFAVAIDRAGNDTYDSPASGQGSSGLARLEKDGDTTAAQKLRNCLRVAHFDPQSNEQTLRLPELDDDDGDGTPDLLDSAGSNTDQTVVSASGGTPPCTNRVVQGTGGTNFAGGAPTPTPAIPTATYTRRQTPIAGLGALIDLAGDDTYRAAGKRSHAYAGPGGVGLLLDLAGSDTFNLPEDGTFNTADPSFYQGELAAASTIAGLAVLLDAGGDDVRVVRNDGLGHALVGGLAVLAELEGDDLYLSSPLVNSTLHDGPSRSIGWAAGGGVALLLDLAGHDSYLAGGEALSASRGGIALLVDRYGDDSYVALRKALGFANATEVPLKHTWEGENQTTGAKESRSEVPFIGDTPEDHVLGERLENGTVGLALFLDAGGDDTYRLTADRMLRPLLPGQDNRTQLTRPEGLGWGGSAATASLNEQVLSGVLGLFADAAGGALISLPDGAVDPVAPTWTDGNTSGVGTAQSVLDPVNGLLSGLPVNDLRITADLPRCIVGAAPPVCDVEGGNTVLTPGATVDVQVEGAFAARVGARIHGFPIGTLPLAASAASCATGACVLEGTLELELPVWAEQLGPGDLEIAAVATAGNLLGKRADAPALPTIVDVAPRAVRLAAFQEEVTDLPTLEWGLVGATDDLDCAACETTLIVYKQTLAGPRDQAEIALAPAEVAHDLTDAELPDSALAALPWSWTLRTRDARGNVFTAEPRTFFIDLLAPRGTAERDEGDGDDFLRGATRFTGAFEDETVLRSVVVDLRRAGRIAAGPFDAALSIASRSNERVVTEWTVDIPALPSGSYSLRAIAEDAAGRTGEATLRIHFDTRAPTMRVSLAPPGIGPSGATQLSGTVTDDASGVQFVRVDAFHRDLDGDRTRILDGEFLTPDDDGHIAIAILAHPLEPGTYVFDLDAEDEVGNLRTQRITIPFDDVPPEPLTALEVGFEASQTRLREAQNVTLTARPVDRDVDGAAARPWKVLVDVAPLAPGVGSVTLADDGNGADALPGDGIFTANVTLRRSIEGRHDLPVTVLDVAGNPARSTIAIEVDNTPPEPEALELVLTRTRARLSASFDELVDASFCIKATGTAGRPACLTRVGSTVKLEHLQLAPGTSYDVSWSFVDLGGNVVSATRALTTLALAAPPAVMIESPAENAPLRGTVLVETILSAPVGQVLTVTVSLLNAQGGVATERVVSIPVTEPGLARTLALDTRVAPDGPHLLRVSMIDLDGLTAASEVPVTVDNTPPAAPTLDVVGVQGTDGWFVTPPVALAEARDATTGVERFLATVGDEQTVLPARQRQQGLATTEVALSDVGTSRLTLEAVDAAGNVGPQRLVEVRFDPTPPHAVLAPGRAAVFANATGLSVPVLATDAESGVSAMQLRVDDRPVTGWLAPAETLSASTRITTGSHTLSLVVRNGAGVPSDALGDVARAPLFVDTDAPLLRSVALASGSLASPSAQTTLSAIATDPTSDVAQMRYRLAGGAWSEWLASAVPASLTLPRPDVAIPLDVQVRDSAGNPSNVLSVPVVHDTRAPGPPGRPAPVRESATGLGLVWEPATDEHRVDHYLVYSSPDGTHFALLGSTRENRFRDTTAILGLPTSYRVVAVDEAGWRSEPGPDARIVPTHLAPMAPPVLSAGHHSPESGTTNTLFVFEVTYTDLDNQQPTFVVLELGGERHAMTRASPADWDCRDGCVYTLPLQLPAITLTEKHEYRFAASDGTYSVAFPEGSSLIPGPLVAKGTSGSEGGIPGLRIVPAPAAPLLALALALALALGRRRRAR